jgi:hypothetical protein
MLRTLNVAKGELAPSPWKSFSHREWDRALAWLDLSGLAIYFHERIRSVNGLHALPEHVREQLEKRRADNRLRNEAIVHEFKTLIGAFEQAGVKYAVLKGISLLPDYCPEMEFRTQYDHDVFVAPESLNAARRVLESAGFDARIEENGESPLIYRRAESEIRFSQKSDALYSPRLGRSIDLHQTLWEEGEERIHVSLSDDFLERGQLRCWEGISFRALCDEDSLLFQILHAFKHILRNWCRLAVFLEIAWFVNRRSADSAFWQSFASRIENVRWAREATFIVFTLSEQLFGAVIPALLRDSLSSPLTPALHLWIERYGQHSAVSNFHDDKCSLFLHREFIDDPSDWAMIRRRRLFPLHRPHRPPAVVFQRSFSELGRIWMEKAHAVRRLRFHGLAGLRYALEYPRWIVLRRLRLAESGNL